jgi:3-phosphoshikimate 1-carboxyvinyltransferase
MERPLSVYETLARENLIEFVKEDGAIRVGGGLASGDFEVSGEVSSQFITGLLIALSAMRDKSTLTVTGKFESEPYVNMTLSVLHHFGIRVERCDRTFTVYPSKPTPTEYRVEGDFSSTAFLEAFNLLSGEVLVDGLFEPSLQGDAVYREYYKRLSRGFDTFDLTDCPDLAPILFALASVLHGGEFHGTARLKIKESDRAEAMRQELSKLGAQVEVYENRVVVHKADLYPPTVPIYSHNDHRIAMAMSVVLTLVGGEVDGAEAITKSFPDFYKTLENLNIGLEYHA